jgi:hypothetical protein
MGTAVGCSSEAVDAPRIPPDRLEFRVTPAAVAAGAPFSPAVQVAVMLPNGAVDATSTAAVSLTTQDAAVTDSLLGNVIVSAVAGIATFPAITLSRASPSTRLVARSAGLTGAASDPIRVVAGEPAQLVFLTQPENVVAGQPLPELRVQLRDLAGNRVTAANGPISVTIATGPGGALITGTLTANLVSGEASFTDIRLPRAGTGYTLSAVLVGSTTVRSPVTRVFTTAPAAPTGLQFLTEPTTSTVGFPITPAIRVAVVDDFGNIVSAASTPVTVELAVGAVGSQLTGSRTVTPVAGIATLGDLRVDRPAAAVRLRATGSGLAPAVSAAFAVGAP